MLPGRFSTITKQVSDTRKWSPVTQRHSPRKSALVPHPPHNPLLERVPYSPESKPKETQPWSPTLPTTLFWKGSPVVQRQSPKKLSPGPPTPQPPLEMIPCNPNKQPKESRPDPSLLPQPPLEMIPCIARRHSPKKLRKVSPAPPLRKWSFFLV